MYYYEVGDRVEYRAMYGTSSPLHGTRGTVLEGAPMSLMTGVRVQWDDGTEQVMNCFQARKLTLLEVMAEL